MCIAVRVQAENEKMVGGNDHMMSTERTDVVYDVLIHSVIDGVFHVSYQDDMMCTTCVGVCGTISDDERSVA